MLAVYNAKSPFTVIAINAAKYIMRRNIIMQLHSKQKCTYTNTHQRLILEA